ncbi:type I polyketide synthase [Paracoccus sp. (in: a-proteobacteria)]|uniref:type I polyketide synthase n=1 Tax=Paracoccus sp. TaxID=267 RepID=UPI00272DC3FB|nr:type I polyketide synthase [Paracoccus sp. (in: a-proteobacteria)]
MTQPRVETSATDSDTPIITGLSCRLPSARGNSAVWDALAQGRCTVTSLRSLTFDPSQYLDPFQNRRGKTYTLAAGQMDGLFDFDASFFGISPREAVHIDPQQRMMLIAVWEAIEDAGLSPADLAGDRTGVFVGSSLVENISLYYADTARSGSSFSLGNTLCIIANRVSAFFDFGGPSYAMDAACASSLYALHQASEAIRTGQVDTAIVGGVHALLSPGGFVGFSQARMLSPTGLCRAFDASADGYVRSEACVALVLQSPRAAQAMMARQRARLLATGANTDGAASQLTVPSPLRQEQLMDAVLSRSGRDPDELAFYEAHGTGTQVGDPVEAQSIGRSMGMLRSDPLLIGSAKTNFGHAEPAAGLIGTAKVLLAMQHRALPASLHFSNPNPNIDFDGLNLEVNTVLRPLAEDGPLLAGVNAFGFGGTNVSAMLESCDPPARRLHPGAALVGARRWLMLSAGSETSLRRLAADWAEALEAADAPLRAEMAAAVAARSSLACRLALPLDDETCTRLRAVAANPEDEAPEGVMMGQSALVRARTVLAFPGNGAQVPGMGVAQYREDPVFRAAFDDVARAMQAQGVDDLVGLIHAPDLGDRLGSPLVAQPLLFGYQVAMAHSLTQAGLRMDAVIGHSVGEIAALHMAGCFDLDAAARIIVTRSRAFEQLRGKGGMAVVAAAAADVERAIQGLSEPDLAIAAINSPRSVTVAGPVSALTRLARVTVAGKRLPMVRLKIEIPYHSPQVETLREQFERDLRGLTLAAPRVTVGGAALGRILAPRDCTLDYLWRNARDTVRFSEALQALSADGPCQVIELAPTPVIQGNVRDIARYGGAALDHVLPVELAAEGGPRDAVIARAWSRGVAIEGARLAGERHGPAPALPHYPWDEAEYRTPLSPDGLDAWGEESRRNLVGRRADRDSAVWMTDMTPTRPGWIADHKVGGNIVLAGALLAEMALSAATELWPDSPVELRHFDILAPTLVEGDGVRLRTSIDPASGAVTLQQRPRLTDSAWTMVARGVLRRLSGEVPAPARARTGTDLPVDDLYDFLTARGLEYGPAFRRMTGARAIRRHAVRLTLAPGLTGERFALDPTALDAAFHGIAAVARNLIEGKAGADHAEIADALREGAILLPTRMGRLRLLAPGGVAAQAVLRVTRLRRRSVLVDILLEDQAGKPVALLDEGEFTLVRLDAATRIAPMQIADHRVRLRLPDQPVRLPKGGARPAAALARIGAAGDPAHGPLRQAIAALHAAPQGDADTLAAVLHLCPDLADDLRALAMTRAGTDPRDTALYGLGQRLCWAEAGRILDLLAARWPSDQRLSVMMTGLPDPALLRRLRGRADLDGLTLWSPDAEMRGLIAQVLPPDLAPLLVEAPQPGSADLVLSVGPAAPLEALAEGGLAVALDIPDLTPDRPAPDGSRTGWLNAGPLPLRLALWHGGPVSSAEPAKAPTPQLLEPLPEDMPADLAALLPDAAEAPAKASHRLLVHRHKAGDSVPASLTVMLMRLKALTPQDTAPLILLAIDADGDAGFAPLVAGLRSAVRTASNEYGDRALRLITLAHDAPHPPSLDMLLHLSEAEPVIHVTPDGLYGERVRRVSDLSRTGPALALRQRDAGRLETLEWRSVARPRPQRGEVEIEVLATGLNFRDVMSARGLLSERILEAGASGAGMGMECAGIVRRRGPGTSLPEGALVMGFARSAFASHVVLPEDALSPLPPGVAPEAAAGLPVAFVTAWEALCNLARLALGETVLIHGGAGGVGLAAIQIARDRGARVLATAGTPEKRDLARAYGAEQVFNSRDLTFVDGVMAATGGRGVDLVLNSLYGEAMQRSVECLAPFGRFVELGKRDYLEGSQLDLRPFARNLTYHGMDLDQRLAADPDRVAATMREIAAGFAEGRLRPIPVTCFGPSEVEEAFRHMLAARHTGKIVIRPPQPGRTGRVLPVRDHWVILGGTGGVGVALARWLLDRGAAHVHLLSRSGDLALGLGAAGRWARGEKRLSLHAVDGTDRAAMTDFLSERAAAGQRIGGVIHGAMVLRDRLFNDLDRVEARQVIDAKLTVAETLADLLRSGALAPDHVLFLSSIAAHLGNPGQAAYSAANAAMEALSAQLRAEGHPALAIGLGAIRDTGYLTRNAAVAAQLSKMDGVGFLRISEVIAELDRALSTGTERGHCLAPINWARLAPMLPALQTAAFGAVVPETALNTRPSGELVETLKRLEWPAALAMVENELRTILSGIMRMPPDQFDPNRPFKRYGLDSLMALELRMEVERRLGTSITTFSLNEDMTAARLAAVMVERIKSDGAGDGGAEASNDEGGPA